LTFFGLEAISESEKVLKDGENESINPNTINEADIIQE